MLIRCELHNYIYEIFYIQYEIQKTNADNELFYQLFKTEDSNRKRNSPKQRFTSYI